MLYFSGETDHFTSFALLLDSPSHDSDCGSDADDYIYLWLSVAFISAACCAVFIAFIAIEIHYRLRKKKAGERGVTVRIDDEE